MFSRRIFRRQNPSPDSIFPLKNYNPLFFLKIIGSRQSRESSADNSDFWLSRKTILRHERLIRRQFLLTLAVFQPLICGPPQLSIVCYPHKHVKLLSSRGASQRVKGSGRIKLRCPGFHGQLINQHLDRVVKHWCLIVQRLRGRRKGLVEADWTHPFSSRGSGSCRTMHGPACSRSLRLHIKLFGLITFFTARMLPMSFLAPLVTGFLSISRPPSFQGFHRPVVHCI